MINSITISNFLFKTSKKKFFFICNILGLAFACLIIFIFGGKFKSTVIINYPSDYDFLYQNQIKKFVQLEDNSLHKQYAIIFNKNFLLNKNLKEFINNNKKDNLLLQKYGNNIKLIKKLPFKLDDGEFFLVFDKGVDGKKLFVDYIDYIEKKSKDEFLSKYRELITLNIKSREEYLKYDKDSADVIIRNFKLTFRLFIGQEYQELNKIYKDFAIEKLDHKIYEDLPSDPSHLYYSNYSIIFFGLMFGSLLFLVIIFLNSSPVNKKKIFS